MSVEVKIYKPGEEVPYNAKEQIDPLCAPELIYPSDLLEDKDWIAKGYKIFLVRDDIPIGVLLAYVKNPTDLALRYMNLAILCVHKDERGKKLADRLLNELERVTRELSIKTIQLSAISGKLKFYIRNGYLPLPTEDLSENEEYDYIAMEKKLGGNRRKRTFRKKRMHRTLRIT